MRTVKNGDFVQLHYTGSLEDDSIFDSSEGREPLEFQVGGGGIIAGFNNAVLDMAVDQEKKVILAPEEAYGHLRDDLKREFPNTMLGDMKIEVGQDLRFSSPQGPITGKVVDLEADKFIVDFNHPLAGKTLTFKIKVVGISDTPTQMSCSCGCSPTDCGTTCG